MMKRNPEKYEQSNPAQPRLNHCGSEGCIAGFIHASASKLGLGSPVKVCEMSNEENTAKLLGVTYNQVHKFYHRGNWPTMFKPDRASFYGLPKNEQVEIAVKRMKLWLKTGGKK